MKKIMAFARVVRIFSWRSAYNLTLLSSSRNCPACNRSTVLNYSTSAQSGSEDSDDLDSIRNISRMPTKYRDRMLHVMKPDPNDVAPDYLTELHQTLTTKKRLYAKYGRKSGMDPGVLWPSETELQGMLEFEQEWEPSLQERWKKLQEEIELQKKERKEKEQLIEKQMAKMPQLIKEYSSRLRKSEEQERQQQMKKQALLDEAREYFGYSVSPNDPRFEQMREMKEEEEKKLKKKKKKEEKLAKFMHSPN